MFINWKLIILYLILLFMFIDWLTCAILYMHVDVPVFKRTISTSWFVNLYGYLWKIKMNDDEWMKETNLQGEWRLSRFCMYTRDRQIDKNSRHELHISGARQEMYHKFCNTYQYCTFRPIPIFTFNSRYIDCKWT
jgi:hypothetical protein